MSFRFSKEPPRDPKALRVAESASKSYQYDVDFRRDNQEQTVPLLIAFDDGEHATKLLTHRFLAEKQIE